MQVRMKRPKRYHLSQSPATTASGRLNGGYCSFGLGILLACDDFGRVGDRRRSQSILITALKCFSLANMIRRNWPMRVVFRLQSGPCWSQSVSIKLTLFELPRALITVTIGVYWMYDSSRRFKLPAFGLDCLANQWVPYEQADKAFECSLD